MAAVVVLKRPSVADVETAADRLRAANEAWRTLVATAEGPVLAEALIQIREAGIDPLEAVFAEGLRRFDAAGEYQADGALGPVSWLRWKCKMTASSASEHLAVARQLDELPKTEQAFSRGEISYQHVAVLARTAEHVGVQALRKAEGSFLKAAETMDPGQLVGVAKDFEHRVDAEAALTEANRAHERRYLHIGEPVNGLVRLDGLLDTEGGAIVRNALNARMLPDKNDDRTAGQRRADALVDLCRQGARGTSADGAAPRVVLMIKASADTLAKTDGAPAGEIEGGGMIPAETVRRLACDSAITRFVGAGELQGEISHASRTIQPATRRVLAARDQHCVFTGCDRRPAWCDGHHLKFWADGGPTTLDNLALLCRPHHRRVHEGGWTLERKNGRFVARPPDARARSGKAPP
jgi:hypothetical protein